MKTVVIGESSGASREMIMAVYPRHKAVVDKFIARRIAAELTGRPGMDIIDVVTHRSMLKTAVTAMLCAVALLLSAGHVRSADDQIDAKSFRCITKMTPVRHFYVDNLRGDLKATEAAANSPSGAVYPPGSVIQLIPGEAMVKRDKGFNAVTHDWEFFELDVSKDGTVIRKRGFADVVNRFGGNCFGCHIAARPEWDLVCETGHGCAPIPLTRAMSGALQRTDPRCDNPPVSAQDAEALKQLNELFKPR